jgi:hypothetical protein
MVNRASDPPLPETLLSIAPVSLFSLMEHAVITKGIATIIKYVFIVFIVNFL